MDGTGQERMLVEAALRREDRAFESLVLRYKDRLFNLCYRFTGDREEARDCTQEAFVRAYRSLSAFRFESSFGTWLYSIAINICRNRLKSADYRAARKSMPLDGGGGRQHGGDPVQLVDPAPSAVEELSRKELELRLQAAIEQLPERPRTLVVLRDIEGLSYEDVARITGMRLGTVKSGLARAREMLRKGLAGVY